MTQACKLNKTNYSEPLKYSKMISSTPKLHSHWNSVTVLALYPTVIQTFYSKRLHVDWIPSGGGLIRKLLVFLII